MTQRKFEVISDLHPTLPAGTTLYEADLYPGIFVADGPSSMMGRWECFTALAYNEALFREVPTESPAQQIAAEAHTRLDTLLNEVIDSARAGRMTTKFWAHYGALMKFLCDAKRGG